jgi:RND superfamily putative drug exporter
MLWQTLSRLGGRAARHPWRVITVWLLAAGLALGAAAALGGRATDSMTVPGLDSQRAADLLHAAGSDRAGMTAQVIATPKDGAASFFAPGPARAALDGLQADIASLPRVLGTNDPAGALAGGRDAAVRSGSVSPDGRVVVLRVQYPDQTQLSADDLNALLAVQSREGVDSPLRVEMGGELFFAFSDQAGSAGELVGILVAAAILLLAFGSLVAAALPIGMAALGLAVGAGIITVLARVTDIPTFAPVLAGMVGLGVGIDYALFVLARHREYLVHGVEVHEAAGRAVGTAGQPVVFAGGTVVVSILGMAVAGVPFMTVGGFAVALVVLIMVIASVTLLPAFLGLAGTRINRFGLPRLLARRTAPDGGWRRWIGHVNRHPVPYAIGAVTLLLALAAPVLALRVGIPDDGSMPNSRTERRAYDLVAGGFGAGTNGPLVIAVDTAGDPTVLTRLAAVVAADPGIASVAPPQGDSRGGIASMIAVPTTGPQEKATADTVTRLRASVLPGVVGDGRAQAHIGGAAANLADIGRRVNDRLPAFIAAVLALSFVLLMLVFRSVFVPLKAVLLNLLSIGASYGVLVMVFEWGWGGRLIGLDVTVPVVSFIPMFMFAILFGLSMDYEMFLLSRVREEYVRSGDNGRAIVDGISGTARVITSAALIMVTVFLAFVFGEGPAIKMLGLGLATAILIDATVVRMVLVPATMTLLGRANWWLPAWLDRLLPRATADADHAPRDLPEDPQPAREPRAVAVLQGAPGASRLET